MIVRHRWKYGIESGKPVRTLLSRIPSRVLIVHEELGRLDLPDRDAVEKFVWLIENRGPDDDLVRCVAEGAFLDPDEDEVPKSEKAARQMRALLLGTDSDLDPTAYRRPKGPRRYLIEQVWLWGTVPQLSGNPKAGKTYLLMDVIFTLLVPGHLFLGRFERGHLSQSELARGIVLINTEDPADDIEAHLAPLEEVMIDLGEHGGTVMARSLVTVFHLREFAGGPAAFDPRDPEKFEQWRRILAWCEECEGNDDSGPLALIADNGTAVLRALREDVQAHLGEWAEAVRPLLDEIGTLNGITVAHATMQGGNALGGSISGAGSDGEWHYLKRGAKRVFWLEPRGPGLEEFEVTVAKGPDGRLLANGSAQPVTEMASPEDEGLERRERLIAALRAFERAGETKTALTGRGDEGIANSAALAQLEEAGRVVSRAEQHGRIRSIRYWLAEFAD